ncbi:MAG: UbiD family decarboxylase [Gemmatimonas sp.]
MSNSGVTATFAYDDLRQWLAEAEKLGEVRHIKGASWEEDIGMATELVNRSETTPALLFEEVPGCPKGFRVLANWYGGQRSRMTLGLPTHLTKPEMSQAYLDNFLRNRQTVPARYVDTGPVLENVVTGADVDLLKFPTPLWHEEDGGRYIGTGGYNVTKDPDEDWINIGTYRVMLHGRNTVGFYISPGKHGRIHRDKYIARNQKMPVVIVLGGDPLTFLTSCTESPYGISEYDIVGGFRGKPVDLVRGRITGLPFPANAEIVIEGWMDPNVKKLEGPFGEWTGYYGSDVREEPVVTIEAVYHRNDPILVGNPPQKPPEESSRHRAVTRSALLRENIEKAGVPDVTCAWAHEVGNTRMLLGVSIKQRYPGHATQAGHIAAMCHLGAYAGKYVVVVDDDVDVSDLEDLMWATVTRSDPATSIDIIHDAWSTPLDPRVTPAQRETRDFTNSRAIINACRPYHWRDQFAKVNRPSPERTRRAMEKFGYLLR